MTLQNLLGLTRKAIDDYNMIEDGDKIAIGLSGGKDSLSLLFALHEMRRFYPKKYELFAITVCLGFDGFDPSPAASVCKELDIPYSVVKTDIGDVVFNKRKEQNPCSLCSKMRKGALHNEALRLGCSKVALGHNKDDVIQTFFLSMFFESRIHTFRPVNYLDRKKIHLLRPLVYVPEKDIAGFIKKLGAAIVVNPCPVEKHTKRAVIKDFIAEQSKIYDNFDDRIFGQIQRLPIAGWERNNANVTKLP